MSVMIELHRFGYLRKDHLRKPLRLNVDGFDPRFAGTMRSTVGRDICELLSVGVNRIPVSINTNEYLGGPQIPFIFVYSDEPDVSVKIVKALAGYFTEEVETKVIPFMRLSS